MPLTASQERITWDDAADSLPPDLLFPNGLGGFTPDGREYCLLVSSQPVPDGHSNGRATPQTTPYPRLAPAPWVNVVANPGFGFLVSESGSGFTWSGNSQANRLTPWNNDPVSDPPGEVVYLRDEESGEIWCPTPLPVPSRRADVGPPRSGILGIRAEHSTACRHKLTLLVPPEDSIKLVRFR